MQEKSIDFERSLEYQFLYNEDPDSVFLLLSWLENNRLGYNFIPKYNVTKALLTGLRRSIRGRKDKKSIVDAISKLVSEDLNRLEMAFTIKGYRNAQNFNNLIDKLEILALKKFDPNDLATMQLMLHDSKDKDVEKFKDEVNKVLIKSKIISNNEYHTNLFLDKYIKNKFFRINFYMDNQVVVDYTNTDILTLEGKNLTINELLHIYSKAKFYINRSLNKAYFSQFWNSLNDEVLCRYQ